MMKFTPDIKVIL